MRRFCCWCYKPLGDKVPLELDEATGGVCDACTFALLEEIHRESGWVYHIILSRGCAHLFANVNLLLQVWPHVRVVVDRRRRHAELAVPPPPRLEPMELFLVPPRPHQLAFRRDCSNLIEDLGPVFADRGDILVLVDRRSRTRTPVRPPLAQEREQPVADPPAFLI